MTRKKKNKIFQKKLVRLKKSCTFATALRNKRIRIERHVHRHIGLTAKNKERVR